MVKKKTQPATPPPPPTPLDPFVEGMLYALKELDAVLWERRLGMHRLEAAVRNAPEADQSIINDVLEPLSGGVQMNVLATVKRRLEDRLVREAQRRMSFPPDDDATPAEPKR